MNYDQRSFIPNDFTIAAIAQDTGVNLDALTFQHSEQTGGYCMADIYTFPTGDPRIGVLTGEVFVIYPTYDLWSGWDSENDCCMETEVDYDTLQTAHFSDNEIAYPEDNNAPALFMAAQLWTDEKVEDVCAIVQTKIYSAIINDDKVKADILTGELSAIRQARRLTK